MWMPIRLSDPTLNWEKPDTALLAHFRRLGKIRKDNPAIGSGRQRTLDAHTCMRYNDTDTIIIRLHPSAGIPISVKGIFHDGTQLTDLYTGKKATVSHDFVNFPGYEGNVAVIRPSDN